MSILPPFRLIISRIGSVKKVFNSGSASSIKSECRTGNLPGRFQFYPEIKSEATENLRHRKQNNKTLPVTFPAFETHLQFQIISCHPAQTGLMKPSPVSAAEQHFPGIIIPDPGKANDLLAINHHPAGYHYSTRWNQLVLESPTVSSSSTPGRHSPGQHYKLCLSRDFPPEAVPDVTPGIFHQKEPRF